MSTIYSMKAQKHLLMLIANDRMKENKETYFYYHRELKDTMWGTNLLMTESMIMWRKMKKAGTLQAKTTLGNMTIGGKLFYTLTIQRLDSDGNVAAMGMDALGLGVKHFVHGDIYWFVNETSRNLVRDYVMK